MTTQPEALRLAAHLEFPDGCPNEYIMRVQAAAELRRLHALNQELLEALKAIIGNQPIDQYGYFAAHNAMDDNKREAARAAIAKATGENT